MGSAGGVEDKHLKTLIRKLNSSFEADFIDNLFIGPNEVGIIHKLSIEFDAFFS
jgi:hypothetical protein